MCNGDATIITQVNIKITFKFRVETVLPLSLETLYFLEPLYLASDENFTIFLFLFHPFSIQLILKGSRGGAGADLFLYFIFFLYFIRYEIEKKNRIAS